MLRQRIKDQFIQGWAGEIQNSSRARFYRNITEFHFQPYLDIINIRKFRTAMTKLRVSSHRLRLRLVGGPGQYQHRLMKENVIFVIDSKTSFTFFLNVHCIMN